MSAQSKVNQIRFGSTPMKRNAWSSGTLHLFLVCTKSLMKFWSTRQTTSNETKIWMVIFIYILYCEMKCLFSAQGSYWSENKYNLCLQQWTRHTCDHPQRSQRLRSRVDIWSIVDFEQLWRMFTRIMLFFAIWNGTLVCRIRRKKRLVVAMATVMTHISIVQSNYWYLKVQNLQIFFLLNLWWKHWTRPMGLSINKCGQTIWAPRPNHLSSQLRKRRTGMHFCRSVYFFIMRINL